MSKSSNSESEYELISSVSQEVNICKGETVTHAIFAQLLLEKQTVKFQIDTGVETNLIPHHYVKHLQISPTAKTLPMWNKLSLKLIGTCVAKVVNPRDDKKYKVSFTVVLNEPRLTPIIGIKVAEHMKLVTITQKTFKESIW